MTTQSYGDHDEQPVDGVRLIEERFRDEPGRSISQVIVSYSDQFTAHLGEVMQTAQKHGCGVAYRLDGTGYRIWIDQGTPAGTQRQVSPQLAPVDAE